jgi:hypothetical protein
LPRVARHRNARRVFLAAVGDRAGAFQIVLEDCLDVYPCLDVVAYHHTTRGKWSPVPNPLQKIDPDHTWIWIAAILIVVIVAIAAWTGASEVRIEVGSFKVVVDWP